MTLDEVLALVDTLPNLPAPPGCEWDGPRRLSLRGYYVQRVLRGSDVYCTARLDWHTVESSRALVAELATLKQEAAIASLLDRILDGARPADVTP